MSVVSRLKVLVRLKQMISVGRFWTSLSCRACPLTQMRLPPGFSWIILWPRLMSAMWVTELQAGSLSMGLLRAALALGVQGSRTSSLHGDVTRSGNLVVSGCVSRGIGQASVASARRQANPLHLPAPVERFNGRVLAARKHCCCPTDFLRTANLPIRE